MRCYRLVLFARIAPQRAGPNSVEQCVHGSAIVDDARGEHFRDVLELVSKDHDHPLARRTDRQEHPEVSDRRAIAIVDQTTLHRMRKPVDAGHVDEGIRTLDGVDECREGW